MAARAAGGGDQAAAMDRMYRVTRHVYDLTRKPYLLGRDRLIERLAPPPGGTVLEVGCGTGRNLVAAARRWPAARFHGFDISEAMLATARRSVGRAGVAAPIALARGDATGFDAGAAFGVSAFDRVYVSYALSMIPEWRAALAEAARLVAPGGRLAVVDFGDGAGLPPPAYAVLRGWLGLFHVTPRTDLPAAAAALAAKSGGVCRVETPYGGYCQIVEIG